MRIVECVPNFSEGRNRAVIDAIADAIRAVAGVRLLDVDPGATTNRTVYTFAGEPAAVEEAAFAAIRRGSELIDMRLHTGAHARQGACDVCPFVPVAGVTMEECVQMAKRLARRVGDELGIPVYLYAQAAAKPERVRLPDIRAGEYEALDTKLKDPAWKPDFGPAAFNARAGATAIGARSFLIAYNVNLNSTNVAVAKEIAAAIRETGRVKRDERGDKVIDPDGNPVRMPGLFKHLQATGWLIPEYGRAQVTMNILDIEATPLHAVFDACCEIAAKLGARVTGSEIVGMVPRRVLIDAGMHFLKKQGSTAGVSESQLIQTAIQSLGLGDVAPFDPTEKIIERHFAPPSPLMQMSVARFADELASPSPAPGGGSVAALAGGLSCALTAMVASLTHAKKGFADRRERMERIGMEAHELMRMQLDAVDRDTEAFNAVMAAYALPKGTDDERRTRNEAVSQAMKDAALVPLATLERARTILDLAREVAERGNPNSLSDAGVAALMAHAAAQGAHYNVLINLASIDDAAWVGQTRARADTAIKEAHTKASIVARRMEEKLG